MFKQASKMKLRFATSKGNLSVEDLWDLSLPVLDKLAVSYDEELAKSPRKSFITNDTPSNTELELKFNIVKEIITDKLKEKADRETAKNKAAEKARLTELLAKKQSEKLESLSEDEIKRRLAELGECVVLKTVSPQILDRLRESGLTVCICCEFEGVAWLTFSPGLPFDIHGEGYDFEELGLIGTEANLRYFEKVTPNYIDCGTDVDKFINTCLQFK